MRKLSVILLPLAMACAPAATTGTTESPMPAPQSAAPTPAAWRTGNYTMTLSAADFPAGMPESARAQMTGTWEIQFHQGNHYVAMHNGRKVVEGPYRISGNQLMFSTGETGPAACSMPATYTWATTNGQTRFTPVGNDPCAGRAVVLTTRPFAFSPG